MILCQNTIEQTVSHKRQQQKIWEMFSSPFSLHKPIHFALLTMSNFIVCASFSK